MIKFLMKYSKSSCRYFFTLPRPGATQRCGNFPWCNHDSELGSAKSTSKAI